MSLVSWRPAWLSFLLFAASHEHASSAATAKPGDALWPGEYLTETKAPSEPYTKSKGAVDKVAVTGCKKAKLSEIARQFDKSLKMAPLTLVICEHTTTEPARTEAALRWAQASPALHEAELQLRKRLVKDLLPFQEQGLNERSNAWLALVSWLNDLALETDMHELRALAAVIQEALLWETISVRSKSVNLHWLLQNVWAVVDQYCRAGRFEDAQRAFGTHLKLEWPAPGRFPVRYFFDTEDYRYVSQGPEPGLRILPAPIALDSVDAAMEILPASLVQRFKEEWPLLAEEAKAAAHLLGQGGDAYPTIATGGQWTKLDIYDVAGWRQDLCKTTLKHLCGMLRGTLRSEGAKAKEWQKRSLISANDETIGLFGVRPGGWASLHSGQDRRLNIHLCLVNCNSSRVIVAGTNIPYHDGSLFAFEDRAQHEVLNEAPAGSGDRINLVIGILHPDFDPDREPKRRGQGMRLDWWLAQLKDGLQPEPQILQQVFLEALHAQDAEALKYLNSLGLDVSKITQEFRPLHEAASLGHTRIAKALLELRADPRATSPAEPVHYAAMQGHAKMVKFLLANGGHASPDSPGVSSPIELAKSQGHAAVAAMLAKHVRSGEL